MKLVHYAALLVLGAFWGASFVFIGLAVPAFGPLCLMFLRVALGGLLLFLLAFTTRRSQQVPLNLRTQWRSYLLIGVLNSALPFTLIAYAEMHIPAALAAILNATTPLFTVLIAGIVGHELLNLRRILGAVLGMGGVGLLVGGSPQALSIELLLGILASLAAACSYGTATVYAARHMRGLPIIYAAITQLLSAALVLALPAAITRPAGPPAVPAILALLALILFSTTCAYLLYFFLLQNIGPTRTSTVTFLVPVFGIFWSGLFLQEQLTPGMVLGLLTIFASVRLVTNASSQRPAATHGKRADHSEA